MSMRASIFGLLRIGHVDDGGAARSGACGRHTWSCLRPRLGRRPGNRNARQAWYWTATAQRTFIVADDTRGRAAARKRGSGASAQADDRVVFACGPISCTARSFFSVGSSLATNRKTGFLSEPLTCSYQAAARDGERVELLPVETLAIHDRMPVALERRDQQVRGLAHRQRALARAQHLHEERDRLEHRLAGRSDRYIRPSRRRRDRRPSPYAVRAARASSPSDRRTSARRSRRRAFACRRTAASVRHSRRCAANSRS